MKGISYSCEESSFREVFKTAGKITKVFLVRRNDGKIAGFGWVCGVPVKCSAVEFATPEAMKKAMALSGTEVCVVW